MCISNHTWLLEHWKNGKIQLFYDWRAGLISSMGHICPQFVQWTYEGQSEGSTRGNQNLLTLQMLNSYFEATTTRYKSS